MIDMSPDEFRRLGYRAIDLLADDLASLRSRPCRSAVPPDIQQTLMHQPLPHEPSEPDALIDYVSSTIFRYPMGNGSPRFSNGSTRRRLPSVCLRNFSRRH